MDKLSAISQIVNAEDVTDRAKIIGIKKILDEEEWKAECIAAAFSGPRKQCIKHAGPSPVRVDLSTQVDNL